MFLPLEPSTWSAGLRANLQWKPEASLGLACVFLSFFKLGYRVTFMCWISNCIKSKKSNEYQVPRVIRFKSNVNACLAKCSVFLCGVHCTEGPDHEPCWQPAASAAEIKQEEVLYETNIHKAPQFCCQQLLPISSMLNFFLLLWHL